MTNIHIKANGATLLVNCDGKITSGTVGLPVAIEYNDEWGGLLKNISFRAGGIVRVQKNVETETTVPWEILRKSGIPLEIGIEGRNENGSIVFPTVWRSAGRILEGAIGQIPAAPNPSNGEDIGGNSSINDDIISKSFVWSSKNTVDKLCPAIEETGSTVQCEPVEGYPMSVVSHYAGDEAPELIKLTHCGKNLIDPAGFTYGVWLTGRAGITVPADGWYVTDWVPVKPNTTYTLSGTSSNFRSEADVNKRGLTGDQIWGTTFTTGADVYYVRFNSIIDGYDKPQLELGSVATPYEPYNGEILTADLTNAPFDGGPNTYDWNTGLLFNAGQGQWHQHDLETGEFIPTEYWAWDDISQYPAKILRTIPAYRGVNTFFSDCGDTTVKGKADPVAIIEKLTNAILALGGNV